MADADGMLDVDASRQEFEFTIDPEERWIAIADHRRLFGQSTSRLIGRALGFVTGLALLALILWMALWVAELIIPSNVKASLSPEANTWASAAVFLLAFLLGILFAGKLLKAIMVKAMVPPTEGDGTTSRIVIEGCERVSFFDGKRFIERTIADARSSEQLFLLRFTEGNLFLYVPKRALDQEQSKYMEALARKWHPNEQISR